MKKLILIICSLLLVLSCEKKETENYFTCQINGEEFKKTGRFVSEGLKCEGPGCRSGIGGTYRDSIDWLKRIEIIYPNYEKKGEFSIPDVSEAWIREFDHSTGKISTYVAVEGKVKILENKYLGVLRSTFEFVAKDSSKTFFVTNGNMGFC